MPLNKVRVGWICLTAALFLISVSPNILASGTVTIPDEQHLTDALSGGGLVTIACDGTIPLTRTLLIAADTTIVCPTNNIILSGGNSIRIMTVGDNVKLTMSNLTLAGGRATVGGALFNGPSGNVQIFNCRFLGNSAVSSSGGGGAINNQGTLGLTACLLASNTVNGVTLQGQGGGVFNLGSLGLTNCTLAGNGGASTIGGALFNRDFGVAYVLNCTFVGNVAAASSGAGIQNAGTRLTLQNSILSGGVNQNATGTIVDAGHNLSSDATPAFSSATSRHNIDARLGPLGNAGGPTEVFPLLAGSPALDAITDGSFPPFDQRGQFRPSGSGGDIGSYEATVSSVETVQFSAAQYSVLENAGTAVIQVTRSNPGTNAVSVGFFTQNVTTNASGNYVATNGFLDFGAGERTKTITIRLIDDALPQGDQTVRLILAAPTGGASLGEPREALLTIIDDEAEAQFLSVIGGGGSHIFQADFSVTLTNTVVVSHDTLLDGNRHDVKVSGGGTVRLFHVLPGVTLTLIDMNLGLGLSTNGGAILNEGAVILSSSVLQGNKARGAQGSAGAAGTDQETAGRPGTSGFPAAGGAVFNLGQLSITNCVFTNNTAVGGSGGDGGAGFSGTTFAGNGGNAGNGARGWGGAIYNGATGSVIVVNTTLAGNVATGGSGGTNGASGASGFPGRAGRGGLGAGGIGGGIFNTGSLVVTNSTFSTNGVSGGDSGNASEQMAGLMGGNALGGAIYNSGRLAMGNSTVANNFAESGSGGNGGNGGASGFGRDGGNGGLASGAGIYSSGTAEIFSSSLARNHLTSGLGGAAGVGAFPTRSGSVGRVAGANVANAGAKMRLQNTLLAYGGPGGNASGQLADGGYNFSSDQTSLFSARGSRNGVDPQLAELADNGGETETMALRPGSPAINAIRLGAFPSADQRGVDRPQGGFADAGAFEAVPTFNLGGRILENGRGVGGVSVSAARESTNGTISATATTSSRGFYTLSNLLTGTYTVTPVRTNMLFAPTNYTGVFIGTNEVDAAGAGRSNLNFTATTIPKFRITGRVTQKLAGVSNVLITANSSGTNLTTLTTAQGFYVFSNLDSGVFIVTPTAAGKAFTPTHRTVEVGTNATRRVGINASNQNFVASAAVVSGASANRPAWGWIQGSSSPRPSPPFGMEERGTEGIRSLASTGGGK